MFIEVTDLIDNNTVVVNLNYVSAIEVDTYKGNECTCLTIHNHDSLYAKESLSDIKCLISRRGLL